MDFEMQNCPESCFQCGSSELEFMVRTVELIDNKGHPHWDTEKTLWAECETCKHEWAVRKVKLAQCSVPGCQWPQECNCCSE